MPLLGDPSHAGMVKMMKELPQRVGTKPTGGSHCNATHLAYHLTTLSLTQRCFALHGLRLLVAGQTTAIIIVSAHWEEGTKIKVTTTAEPPMLFDYHGFPNEAYQYTYDAPGDPGLARRIISGMNSAGIPCEPDATRGYDHGVFVPLMLAYPDADIPVVCVSLHASFDPAVHLQMGRVLHSFRKEGALLLGSGMTFHKMQSFFNPSPDSIQQSRDFDAWLVDTCTTLTSKERNTQLIRYRHETHYSIPLLFFKMACNLDFEMCFTIGSQHLWCRVPTVPTKTYLESKIKRLNHILLLFAGGRRHQAAASRTHGKNTSCRFLC